MDLDKPVNFDETDELDVELFIRKTTYDIWDRKLVGKIYDCYSPESVIHGPDGLEIRGADAIVTDTLEWLASFPDLKSKILHVIWRGNAKDGYLVSMPWVLIGTNTGPSKFGPATGKKLFEGNNLGICNTLIKKVDGKWTYVEEWSTYDSNARKKVCSRTEE